MGTLQGKAALVTGGSRGIGAAIAARLAEEGADVALTYVAAEEAAGTVLRAIEAAGARGEAIRADAADPAAVRAAVDRAAAAFGRLDILVNNAGVLVFGPVDELALEGIERTWAVNVRAVIVGVQAAVPHMARGGGGRVITIGSCNADRMPVPGGAVYAMSKAALVGLTKGLARDLGPRGITVNNVQPGPIDTDMNPAAGPFADTMRGFMALPAYGTGADVAAMVAYLAGPGAGFVTGASLTVDGGYSA
jgi:3-oxoacyl-[acyl-carrier protein] reductase